MCVQLTGGSRSVLYVDDVRGNLSLLSPISLLDNLADPSNEADEAETRGVDVTGTLELRRPKGL